MLHVLGDVCEYLTRLATLEMGRCKYRLGGKYPLFQAGLGLIKQPCVQGRWHHSGDGSKSPGLEGLGELQASTVGKSLPCSGKGADNIGTVVWRTVALFHANKMLVL